MALPMPYSFCFVLLLPLLTSTNAQTHANISLGSSLTARKDDSFWPSPSGVFAFGFRQLGNGYLLAIWFNKLPERTIVWSANRDRLVGRGSKLQLTNDGQLILNDQSNQEIWNKYFSGVRYAAMLDSGNFVLADVDSATLWGSFGEPTDTILPTQIMDQGATLISCYSRTNYSNGRFMFALQGDGNLVLYTTNYPMETNNAAYWSTQTSMGSGYQVIFNQSGYIYLIAKNGTILNDVFSNASPTDFYQRATIDHDGVFRHYAYPKNATSTSGRWSSSWTVLSFIPGNICTRVGGDTGGGACGFNSYCRLGEDQRPNCLCPDGYSFLDPNDESKGCNPNFIAQNCDAASQETDAFDFVEMQNTDWPLADYEHFTPVSEDWCRQACLSDCYCSVVIYRGQDCWKKKIPLSNGRMDSSVGGKALIKVRRVNSTSGATSSSKEKDRSTLILIGSVFLGSSAFLNVLFLMATLIFFYSRNRQKANTSRQPRSEVMLAMNPRSYTYEELEAATDGFKEELGSGAFGTVYRGVIMASENEKFIAVKKLKKVVTEGEKEFETEVNIIGGTNHKNLVKLVGFCNDGQNRMLVYEHLSNGCLANFLFGDSRPNWYRRMQIAFGIARGLSYLHEECSSQIIHCDIKPQNILLDENLTARISDFGLAKLLKADQSQTVTGIRGTKGYVAPEWFKNMPITSKVDVYSFGILLLEIICCRRNFEMDGKGNDPIILSDWAYDCYKEGNVKALVEDDEEAMEDMKRVERFVMVGIWCIQEDPSLRPVMKKVMLMLEGAVPVSVPPDPDSFISTLSCN